MIPYIVFAILFLPLQDEVKSKSGIIESINGSIVTLKAAKPNKFDCSNAKLKIKGKKADSLADAKPGMSAFITYRKSQEEIQAATSISVSIPIDQEKLKKEKEEKQKEINAEIRERIEREAAEREEAKIREFSVPLVKEDEFKKTLTIKTNDMLVLDDDDNNHKMIVTLEAHYSGPKQQGRSLYFRTISTQRTGGASFSNLLKVNDFDIILDDGTTINLEMRPFDSDANIQMRTTALQLIHFIKLDQLKKLAASSTTRARIGHYKVTFLKMHQAAFKSLLEKVEATDGNKN